MGYFLVYQRAKHIAAQRNCEIDHRNFIETTPFAKINL